MAEYGCKAYWKCMDGFSVGHCCPSDSKYVEGIGCLAGAVCNEDCPPLGGIAIKREYHMAIHTNTLIVRDFLIYSTFKHVNRFHPLHHTIRIVLHLTRCSKLYTLCCI